MEAKKPGHLRLASSDLGGDLRLGHSVGCGRTHRLDELVPRTPDQSVTLPGDFGQNRAHDETIASAIPARPRTDQDKHKTPTAFPLIGVLILCLNTDRFVPTMLHD